MCDQCDSRPTNGHLDHLECLRKFGANPLRARDREGHWAVVAQWDPRRPLVVEIANIDGVLQVVVLYIPRDQRDSIVVPELIRRGDSATWMGADSIGTDIFELTEGWAIHR